MNYVTQKNMKDILDGIKGKVPMGQFVSTQTASDSPLGTIIAYMGITPPDGFLACDGSTYNIADYTALATHIMNEFGSYNYFGGDGTTTFAVPDLRGEFLRGTGTNSHTNQGSGASVGVHQDGTEHQISKTNANINVRLYYTNDVNDNYKNPDTNNILDTSGYSAYTQELTKAGQNNNGSYYTSRPTNTSVLYCIKYTAGVSNQYSTTEQVVGQWINGKPLYQITIQDTMPTVTTDGTRSIKIIDISSLNMSMCVDIEGFTFVQDGMECVPINSVPRIENNRVNFCQVFRQNSSNSYIDSLFIASYVASFSNKPCYITIKYTKV